MNGFVAMPLAQDPISTTVTISFVPEQVITWLIIGLIAGFAAGFLVRGRNMGTEGSILLGLAGALVGGFLFSLLGIQVPEAWTGGILLRYIDIAVAFLGSIIVLVIFGALRRRR